MAQAQLLRAVIARALLPAAAIAAGALMGLATPLGAQGPNGIDLPALRARAAAQAREAETFARAVARRGEALRDEARTTAEVARAAARRAASEKTMDASASVQGFDFDAMVRAAGSAGDVDSAPRLIAFASLSMPAAALKQMIADVGQAGGSVVFRGFPGQSVRTFTAALAKVLPEGPVQPGLGIDPRLFRAFGVDAVPVYVVTNGPVELCDGFGCRSTPPPHDIIRGNVTLGYALDRFAHGGGAGTDAAASFERRLERSR